MRRLIPILAAMGAAGAATGIGWTLVRRDVATWEAQGFSAAPEFKFVVFLAVAAAVVAFLVARRIVFGPRLARDEWLLVPSLGPKARVGELRRRLDARGYRLGFFHRSPLGEGSAHDEDELTGALFIVRDQRVRHGGVAVAIHRPSVSKNQAAAWGSVESLDGTRGTYLELAQFLMLELGRMLPGTTFRRASSALSPESTETLEPQLPDAPRALPR